MNKLDFEKWKKDWFHRIPGCEKFSCCHELMSCGIKIFCGDCSIFGTYINDNNPRECTTVGCDDCINKYDCVDYGKNREIDMERRGFKDENIGTGRRFEEFQRREQPFKELPKKEPIKKEPIKKEQKKEESLVKSFLNKDIILMMRGGNKLIGKLESVAPYELLITINYSPVIVLKHAVDYITLVEESKEKPKDILEPLKIQG